MVDNSGQFGAYNVDVCLCIDKTKSMDPIIDIVKKNALNLYRDVLDSLETKGKHVAQFRIRVIWFGDFVADEVPILASGFLNMPDELNKYEEFVKSIVPNGGGDTPEDGLEALAYAIRSDWVKTGWRKRHIIALFTDAPAHDLGFCKNSPRYPKKGMPKDYAELHRMWGNGIDPAEMDNRAKRLLLFAPNVGSWNKIMTEWNNAVLSPAEEANGLQDVTYQAILNSIAHSV